MTSKAGGGTALQSLSLRKGRQKDGQKTKSSKDGGGEVSEPRSVTNASEAEDKTGDEQQERCKRKREPSQSSSEKSGKKLKRVKEILTLQQTESLDIATVGTSASNVDPGCVSGTRDQAGTTLLGQSGVDDEDKSKLKKGTQKLQDIESYLDERVGMGSDSFPTNGMSPEDFKKTRLNLKRIKNKATKIVQQITEDAGDVGAAASSTVETVKASCPICSIEFELSTTEHERSEHVHECLVGRAQASEEDTCQICKKDLSRMNSAQKQQHVNKCCDDHEEIKDNQCFLCKKTFKTNKSLQTHVKKCMLSKGIITGDDIVGPAKTGARTRKNTRPRIKDLDEETKLALALSASLATDAEDKEKPPTKKRGKKRKERETVPELLLRNEEEAQRVIAARVADVIANQDVEISCTPALAPSVLGQQKCEDSEKNDELRELLGLHEADEDRVEESECTEETESRPVTEKPKIQGGAKRLWNLASLDQKYLTNDVFYVPGLLPKETFHKKKPAQNASKAEVCALQENLEEKKADSCEVRSECDSSDYKDDPSPRGGENPDDSLTASQAQTAEILADLFCSQRPTQSLATVEEEAGEEDGGFLQVLQSDQEALGHHEEIMRRLSGGGSVLEDQGAEPSEPISLDCDNPEPLGVIQKGDDDTAIDDLVDNVQKEDVPMEVSRRSSSAMSIHSASFDDDIHFSSPECVYLDPEITDSPERLTSPRTSLKEEPTNVLVAVHEETDPELECIKCVSQTIIDKEQPSQSSPGVCSQRSQIPRQGTKVRNSESVQVDLTLDDDDEEEDNDDGSLCRDETRHAVISPVNSEVCDGFPGRADELQPEEAWAAEIVDEDQNIQIAGDVTDSDWFPDDGGFNCDFQDFALSPECLDKEDSDCEIVSTVEQGERSPPPQSPASKGKQPVEEKGILDSSCTSPYAQSGTLSRKEAICGDQSGELSVPKTPVSQRNIFADFEKITLSQRSPSVTSVESSDTEDQKLDEAEDLMKDSKKTDLTKESSCSSQKALNQAERVSACVDESGGAVDVKTSRRSSVLTSCDTSMYDDGICFSSPEILSDDKSAPTSPQDNSINLNVLQDDSLGDVSLMSRPPPTPPCGLSFLESEQTETPAHNNNGRPPTGNVSPGVCSQRTKTKSIFKPQSPNKVINVDLDIEEEVRETSVKERTLSEGRDSGEDLTVAHGMEEQVEDMDSHIDKEEVEGVDSPENIGEAENVPEQDSSNAGFDEDPEFEFFYDDEGYNCDLQGVFISPEEADDQKSTGPTQESISPPVGDETPLKANSCPDSEATGSKRKVFDLPHPESPKKDQDNFPDITVTPEVPIKTKADPRSLLVTPLQCASVKQVVTPMPNFEEMDTPSLQTELKKFGVRPLAKRKMVQKLTEIYQYTHRGSPGSDEEGEEEDFMDCSFTSINNSKLEGENIDLCESKDVSDESRCDIVRTGATPEHVVPTQDESPAANNEHEEGKTDDPVVEDTHETSCVPEEETENLDDLMSCSPPHDWFFDDEGFNCDLQEFQDSPVAQPDPVQVSEKVPSVQEVPGPSSLPSTSNAAGKATSTKTSSSKSSKLPSTGPKDKSNRELSPVVRVRKRRKKAEETTQTPAQPRAEKKVVTPMPDFDAMNTPGLKVELKKFGVRALPKKKMRLKLIEIYQYTHRAEPDSDEEPSTTDDEDEEEGSDETASQTSDADCGGYEGSESAQGESEEKEEEEEEISASQQESLSSKIFSFFRENEDLHETVLQYKTLELKTLETRLKQSGLKINTTQLLDFLDEQCIAFTMPRPSRQPRQRRGKVAGTVGS